MEMGHHQRLVIFGKIDLTVKAGLAHHWSIKLVECPHDPPCQANDWENGAESDDWENGGESLADLIQCLNAEGLWFEVDGFQIYDPKHLKNNSLNGSYITPADHRGVKSRLQSAPECIVGVTGRSDIEIFNFNKDYLARNPKYSLLRNNCQNYADEFCNFLCESTDVLGAAGIMLEDVHSAVGKVYKNMPESLKEAVEVAEAAATDEDSRLYDVVEKTKSGFYKLRVG